MKLTVKELSFSYGRHSVLRQVNFTLEGGKAVCVLGKNGAGKSTLFQCILGLFKNYQGEIVLDGENLKGMSPKRLAGLIAYIPQTHTQPFDYPVLDMVLMGTNADFSVFASPSEKQRLRAGQALETVGIQDLAERSYLKLSGGEQQLVLIARALAQNGKILLMDEPCANLDYGNQIRVLKTLKELAGKGYLVIQSTHNPDHAFFFADCALVLAEGQIKAFGAPNEVLTKALLEELYQIPLNLHELPESSIRCCVPQL